MIAPIEPWRNSTPFFGAAANYKKISNFWRGHQNENDPKNEDDLKTKEDCKIEDDLKDEDDLKMKDNLKNEDSLKKWRRPQK